MYVIKATEYFIFSVFTLPQAHWKKDLGVERIVKSSAYPDFAA